MLKAQFSNKSETVEEVIVAFSGLRTMGLLGVAAMLLVMVAMGVDLMFGWRKAKLRGDAHSSYAFSRTITKFALYEGVLIIGLCIDTLIHFAWPVFSDARYLAPCVEILIAIILCAVEIWSMREKADQKTRNRVNDVATMIAKTIGKDQLARMIAEAVKKEEESDE